MTGTEKQITWASEILGTVNAVLDDFARLATNDPCATPEMKASAVRRIDIIRTAVNAADAGDIISMFRDVKHTGNPVQGIQTLLAVFNVFHPTTEGQTRIIDAYRDTINRS